MSSKNTLVNNKISTPFRKADLFLYLSVIFIITILFVVFAIILPKGESGGFRVFVGEKEVIVFKYDGGYEIAKGFKVEEDINDDLFVFTIYTEDDGFNVIQASVKDKTVSVIESNCSNSKECVHTPKIKGNSGAIICIPHNLRVLPLTDGYQKPVTG